MSETNKKRDLNELNNKIRQWGKELGFQQVGISDIDLKRHEKYLQSWLDHQFHGEMSWMAQHGMMRARPDELVPNTLRVISVRMDYLPQDAQFAQTLNDPSLAYISRYALGRDYHKLLRQRLKKLGEKIKTETGEYGFRPFVDSAPVLERPLAEKAGLGWVGKHSLLINQDAGSWFFLGELFVDIPLPIDKPAENQCGKCVACMTSCPTKAIVGNKIVDARRCISYLTIEFDGIIPVEFRQAIGNRIYGCDDCQLVCPFTRRSQTTNENDFQRRACFDDISLITLFNWDETTFLKNTEGSAIRRIGYAKWQRNIIIALGNADYDQKISEHLRASLGQSSLLDEHIHWALQMQEIKKQRKNIPIKKNKHDRLIRIIEKGLPRDA